MKPAHWMLLIAALICATAWAVLPARTAPSSGGPTGTPGTVGTTVPVEPSLLAALVEAIRARPANALAGPRLLITSVDRAGDWAIATVGSPPDVADDGEGLLSRSTLVLARAAEGRWTAAIMGTEAYERLLDVAPASLAGDEAIALLRSPEYAAPPAYSAVQVALKWPWKAGQAWQYSQGRHGTANSAIDLAPFYSIPPAERRVVAAARGVIIRRCDDDVQSNVAIRHWTGTGVHDVTGYLHIDKNTAHLATGTIVEQGDVLGLTYNQPIPNNPAAHPCGWSTGPHIHFYVGTTPAGNNASGSITAVDMASTTLSGWTLGTDNCFRGGSGTGCPGARFVSDNASGPSATATRAASPGPTATPSRTPTLTRTPTPVPSATATRSATPAPSRTATATRTPAPTGTATATRAVTGELHGEVRLQGRSDSGGTRLAVDGTPVGTTGPAGEYRLAGIAPGTHTLRAAHSAYLAAETGVVVTAGETSSIAPVVLACGDANGDAVVNVFDLALVGAGYGTRPPSDPRSDLNGDGAVDLFDLVLLGGNYGLQGPIHWP